MLLSHYEFGALERRERLRTEKEEDLFSHFAKLVSKNSTARSDNIFGMKEQSRP